MSTLKVLKEYLVGDGGYLLNDDNNGKTVMLSGAWGSGKTHFWQNEIVREQIKIQGKTRKVNKYSAKEYKEGLFSILQKKKKACVYISLYGKDNIEDIKSQVFAQAYAQIPKKGNKGKNIDKSLGWLGYGSKITSSISIFGLKIDTTQITDKVRDYQDSEKLSQAQEAIKYGGVICFDDFERKSKHIDLNDLFGVITQLSLEFNCKVVIILNSDVFKGEEANVFKSVKEKTVNKFFYFKPSIGELFEGIYKSHDKYKKLDNHKNSIVSVIKETKELNARIYIQILDNCLEFLDTKIGKHCFEYLVLNTIYFMVTHKILKYPQISEHIEDGEKKYSLDYSLDKIYTRGVVEGINSIQISYISGIMYNNDFTLTIEVREDIIDEEVCFLQIEKYILENHYSEIEKKSYLDNLYNNQKDIKNLWKYGYQMFYRQRYSDQCGRDRIINFIRNGYFVKEKGHTLLSWD
jgi:hypothetical protein